MATFLALVVLMGIIFALMGVRMLLLGKTFKKSGCGSAPQVGPDGKFVECAGNGSCGSCGKVH